MNSRILIVAAHPDDEVLGCGGTIAKHIDDGDQVHILIIAEGATSRKRTRNRQEAQPVLSELARQAHEASRLLGADSLELLDYPDNRLDSINLLDLVKVVEDRIDKYQPEIIYTHWVGDLNIDHQVVHKAVVTASRPLPGHSVKTVLFFEIPSSSEWQVPGSGPPFMPNWYSDISSKLEKKLSACKAYHSEMRDAPHPRSMSSIEQLARWRGSNIGVKAAEAFVLGKNIEPDRQ